VEGLESLRGALADARTADGPVFIRMRVGTAAPATELFLEDPVVFGAEFTRWLRTDKPRSD
jgi:hypothetical protein